MMKILTPNLFDGCAVSSSGDGAGYPASNVQDIRLSRYWRSATDVGDQYLEFDAGVGNTITIDSMALVAHNIPAGATITAMLNSVDTWVAPPVSVVGTWSAGPIYIPLGGSQTYRYARILLHNVSGAGFVQAGRAIGALAWVPTLGLGSNFTKTFDDTSLVDSSVTGQDYSDIGIVANIYIGELVYPDDGTRQGMEAIYKNVGQRIPFLLIVDDTNMDKLPPLYCRFDQLPSFSAATAWRWLNAAVKFKERF